MSGVTIQNNGSYGVYADNANTTISNCVISGHSYPYLFNAGTHSLSGNTIAGNTNLAVACSSLPQSCTWPASWGLPIVPTSLLYIQNGATLTIESGVEVRLNNTYLRVGSSASNTGVLIADGVTFTGTNSNARVWLDYGSGQQITNCTFDGAYLYLDPDASGTISDNNIDAHNSGYGIYCNNGNWTITGGTVEGAGSRGIFASGGTLNVSGVTILGSQQGLYVSGSTNATAQYCSFVGQTSYGVENAGTGTVDARYCYWGASDGPGPVGPGSGSNVSTNVLYDPWLHNAPNPSVPGGLNTIILDFTAYTPPGGYGTSEEHALYVKQYVADRFVINNVNFTTSFEGPVQDPNTASQVILGGTNPDPNMLGFANTDPGNTNWTDTAFVFTDQLLFSTIPNDPNEYKYMLANTSAHEIGHLLGYDHGQSAGMPFMNNGSVMETEICQDLLLGELGEITQQKWTYIAETDFDTAVAKPQLVYIQKENIAYEIINELTLAHNYDNSGFNWKGADSYIELSMSLAELFENTAKGPAHFLGLTVLSEVPNMADNMVSSTLRMLVGKEESMASLSMGDNNIVLQANWDETQEKYMFYLDPNIITDFDGPRISISFFSPFQDSYGLTMASYDSDPNVIIDEKYVTLANVDPMGDISGDGITDYQDFAFFAGRYLETGTYLDRLEGADLYRDEVADNKDLFILVLNWLETTP